MSERSEGRVALITGGGKGVGAGVARVLAREGIRCCVNCNSNPDMARDTLGAIEAAGGEAFVYRADVSDPERVNALVRAVVARWGRLDILVNHAAMQPNRYIDEYDADTLRRLWSVNLGGYWRCAKAAAPYLRESPCGRIVNLCSVHANRPTCFDAGYSMTKGAIRMFTRELALELTRDQITVNAITLGGCRIEFKTGHPKWDMQTPLDVINPALRGVNRLVDPVDLNVRLRVFRVFEIKRRFGLRDAPRGAFSFADIFDHLGREIVISVLIGVRFGFEQIVDLAVIARGGNHPSDLCGFDLARERARAVRRKDASPDEHDGERCGSYLLDRASSSLFLGFYFFQDLSGHFVISFHR